ncbi:MAG: tyrosine-type recombinase/integrase, partial [Verrucomicrobiota bacterium]
RAGRGYVVHMKTTLSLLKIRPSAHDRYRQLPLFGRFLDDFVPWAFGRGYTTNTIYLQLDAVRHLAIWCRRKGWRSSEELTVDDLAAAHRCFSTRRRDPRFASGLEVFSNFLQAQGRVRPGRFKPLTRSEQEIARFVEYLRNNRGAAESTCDSCQRRLYHFLNFLGFDDNAMALKNLLLTDVHRYLRRLSDQHQPPSMQHVVGDLRGFLRFQFMQGILHQPLHLQIGAVGASHRKPLPHPIQWSELQHLLQRIDRSTPLGLRDYAVLLLAITYGLRASDVANLTLDAVDWRKRTIQIVQCKTRQPLSLPLTDEVGAALSTYLRRVRPVSSCRQIFLRYRAPVAPFSLPGMSNTLRRASRKAGVTLPATGFRCLRHALALRLLRQGESLKGIADILGHRSTTSTTAYLRLNIDDLRQVALPAPPICHDTPKKLPSSIPRSPRPVGSRVAPRGWVWGSALGTTMRDYLVTQRALGLDYETQDRTLRGLDFFLVRHYPRARRFTSGMFTAWVDGLRALCPTTARMRMLDVRKFCCFRARSCPGMFIPDLRTFPQELPHQAPYLLSEAEMARILAATVTLRSTRRNPLHPQTIRLAFLIMFCCGLRRGEILKLRLADIDAETMVLSIHETKFHKSRLVPLSLSVAAELRRYLRQRRQNGLPMEPSAPLVWNGHSKRRAMAFSSSPFWGTWQRVCGCAHVFDHRRRPPRLHDMRHSFAVEVLRRGYSAGQNAQAVLPRLARYMGHAGAQFTHYYLKFTEPLRCAASDRFHQHMAGTVLPPANRQKGGVR